MGGKERHYFGTPDDPIFIDEQKSKKLFVKGQRVLPDGYIRVSEAVSRLEDGIWGGLRRAPAVVAAKAHAKKGSIGSGPRSIDAGKRVRTAGMEGKLAIYVIAKTEVRRRRKSLNLSKRKQSEPIFLPVSIVEKLIPTWRGRLPDHPIRPSLKNAGGDRELHWTLTGGLLVVREKDFKRWYRSVRAELKWPSQKMNTKPRRGRPTKQTAALRNKVAGLVIERTKTGKINVSALRRKLIADGCPNVPSVDTLARLVKGL